MSSDMNAGWLKQRVAELQASDPQFAAARPDAAVTAALRQPGLRMAEQIRIALTSYADRPALAQRAVRFEENPQTGAIDVALAPEFDTVTYAQLWNRVVAMATALSAEPGHAVQLGDRICVLGFTSIDYTTIDLAAILLDAVAVPLQTSAPVEQLRPIVEETGPTIIASSIDNLNTAAELASALTPPARLLVFDYRPQVDSQRTAFENTKGRLAASGAAVESLSEVIERGSRTPGAPATESANDDALALLLYTSGSTGAPKGAMYSQRLLSKMWVPAASSVPAAPIISLNFMPMSHMMGRGLLFRTLANGGIAYFAAKSDLSSFLDDLALVRPTQLNFVPRVWETILQEADFELARQGVSGGLTDLDDEAKTALRQRLLGERYVSASSGSAPMSGEMKERVEAFLGVHVVESYGSTEARGICTDGHIQRPTVTDYRLVDVPELGYFGTDRPHPRGELWIKSADLVLGYYKRPELTAEVFDADGWYHTGDIMAELGPDLLQYVDRRNSVVKLSQGEFVTISKLESVYADSPLIQQIYVYANSSRPYVLAVVVPSEAAVATHGADAVKTRIAESMREVAENARLQPYEIPRDFLLETTPFTLENGLLTGIRKLARPKLKEYYGPALEHLYVELADAQETELRALRDGVADRPVFETVCRAATALLGGSSGEFRPDAHFADLGGDSLSALTFANLLQELFDVEVPVSVIISPATDLQGITAYIEAGRASTGFVRPTFGRVHGPGATLVRASELCLDKFFSTEALAPAAGSPEPSTKIRTVLLTGATGYLGRYLALEWLECLASVGGTLICLVRASDDAAARKRLDATFDTGDERLWHRYQALAAEHLEVLAGDKGDADLGLDPPVWQRLAENVDLIVDPAALVNHVLPYNQLFAPNVVGTAELIRLAVSRRMAKYAFVSTIGVGGQVEAGLFTEAGDIRGMSPVRRVDDSYANGYGNSKWAAEVLLREAHDHFGLPVVVFRSNMILAEPRYAGQLNVPDMVTRLILSLLATGIAPATFYEVDADGNRPRAHYDGLPVDFIAEAITSLCRQMSTDARTYHVVNPHDDGISLDTYVDWLIDAGYTIQRIADHSDWVSRFEASLRVLPPAQRQRSLLPLLSAFSRPLSPTNTGIAPADDFRAAVQDAKIGADKDIPHISAEIIAKYASDLEFLGLL